MKKEKNIYVNGSYVKPVVALILFSSILIVSYKAGEVNMGFIKLSLMSLFLFCGIAICQTFLFRRNAARCKEFGTKYAGATIECKTVWGKDKNGRSPSGYTVLVEYATPLETKRIWTPKLPLGFFYKGEPGEDGILYECDIYEYGERFYVDNFRLLETDEKEEKRC